MNGLLQHLGITLRLYARNKMALFYSYLFPVIFFVAFLVLYRFEQPKLIQHMGELLTVSILGGACFGLPTSLVSDRERGVWRRYKLAPIATGSLVASTLVGRYVTVLAAGVIQLVLGMAIGGWVPQHPFDLWVSFSLVTFAFLGLGLVIATLADTVPAVQALGQCIFLPMLIIGGVAVKLTTLPEWALHVSAFFPGRYAVETMQECVKGDGLGAMGFNLFALVLIGIAGCLAGVKLFRWDAQQRFISSGNKAWLGVALATWVVIGVGAEYRREITPRSERRRPLSAAPVAPRPVPAPAPAPTPPVPVAPTPALVSTLPLIGSVPLMLTNVPTTNLATPDIVSTSAPVVLTNVALPDVPPPTAILTSAPVEVVASMTVTNKKPVPPWKSFTTNDYAKFKYEELPSDEGSVAPIASDNDEISPGFLADWMEAFIKELQKWPPGKVEDPVQRVRNLLFVAGAIDEARHPLERFVPLEVLARLQKDFKDEELAQIFWYIANHPEEGDDKALDQFEPFGMNMANADVQEIRARTFYYSLKLLKRVSKW